MCDYLKALEKSKLFNAIPANDIAEMLICVNARIVHYENDNLIIGEGDSVSDIGVVLSGCARSVKTDSSGRTLLVALRGEGDFVGVLLASSREKKSPVSVRAFGPVSVLFIPIQQVTACCSKACPRHSRLLDNLIDGIAEKALELHDRNDCLIKASVREKILTYLNREAKEKKNRVFTVPLDRNSMSEYLNVERSALSRELSRMKRDGLIDFYKSSFKLL